ncbi:MarR family transcriptional regulator [Frankia sp. Cpl3]|uniref:MarR family winged helix-turn-helix transcriptional regulator n=1 Tax=Parafrankia colletiae TaxID=573497 RepID=UPI000A8A47C8|nr:MarR family transcriptional regulator [Parafrankia colletiae]MCK9900090.1 MarR family transcriptional regulator [Frankia sp. Cpl3]
MIKYTRAVDGAWNACIDGHAPDQIDDVVEHWQRERPDLDISALGTFARMKVFVTALGSKGDPLEQYGLTSGDFEVLAALRAVGPPCVLIPSQLSEKLMMSRAGITNRLDRLEDAGLVERRLDPADRRSFRVGLTERGRVIIDAAFTEQVTRFARLAAHLTPEQRQHLDDALRTLLGAL